MGFINHTDLKLDKDVRAAVLEDWKWATFRERLSRAFACDDIFYSVENLKEMKKEEGETLVAFARRFETTSEPLIENGFLGEIERCGIFIGTLPIERREFVMKNMPTKEMTFAQTRALVLQTGGPDAKAHLLGVLEKLGKGVPGSHLEKQFGDEDGREFMPPDKSKVRRDSGEWKGGNRGNRKKDDDKEFQDRRWRSREEEEERRRSYSEGWETVEEIEALRAERERMKKMKNVSPRRSATSLKNRYKKGNGDEDILCRISTETNIGIKTRTVEEPEQGEFWVPSVRFEEDLDANDNLTIGFSSIRFEDSEEDSYATLVRATEANGELSKDRTDSASLDIDVSPTGEDPRVIEEALVDQTTTMKMITIDEECEDLKSVEDTQDELIEDQDERDLLDEVVRAKISQAFEVTSELDDNYGLAQLLGTVEPNGSYELAQLFETVESDDSYELVQLFETVEPDDSYELAQLFETVEPDDNYELAQLFETVEADVSYGFAQLFEIIDTSENCLGSGLKTTASQNLVTTKDNGGFIMDHCTTVSAEGELDERLLEGQDYEIRLSSDQEGGGKASHLRSMSR
ncbi:hypothetical protein CBR_g8626 [Chara braunii]|uniref:Retrotransposon gag domain-containing protein n=1 Tax=Chara braunii TaxID=69332 RepID=A0A388JS49_CHABU|nr:hypothetical protein CBR_g8626 [Chara braunii]|eukprot:GBG60605.1 hypothetical protein CBR_g8626 [Chara braunii]